MEIRIREGDSLNTALREQQQLRVGMADQQRMQVQAAGSTRLNISLQADARLRMRLYDRLTYTLTQDAQDGHVLTLEGSDGSRYTVTVPDRDTTYSPMTGAAAGAAGAEGLVPAPAAGDQGKYLRGDGTWQVVSGGGSGVTYTLTQDAQDGHRITLSGSDGSSYTLTIPDADTTYSAATQSVEGLLSAADKAKLDGIESGAQTNVQSDWSAASGDAAILNKPAIPAATSELINDSGYISTETDPTVPAWAKAASKPAYTAAEVGALPDTTPIPANTSDLNNDSGFITSVPDMTGATGSSAGTAGLVPAPAAGDNTLFLRGDGTWQQAGGGGITFDDIYPVGSIYMSVNSVNPGTLFGGTWTQIQDTFLLAAGSTYAAGTTGGEAQHTLTDNELPKLNGAFGNAIFSGGQTASATGIVKSTVGTLRQFQYNGTATNSWKNYTISFGNDQPHNNMPPYLAVYVWQRIA